MIEFKKLLLPGEVQGRDMEFTYPGSPLLHRGPIQTMALDTRNFIEFYMGWIAIQKDDLWFLKKDYYPNEGEFGIPIGGFSMEIATVNRISNGLITIRIGGRIHHEIYQIFPTGEHIEKPIKSL